MPDDTVVYAGTPQADQRWGREWAKEWKNRGRLRRLAEAVELHLIEGRYSYGQMEEAARDLLDNWNQDANGAGTLLAGVLAGDDVRVGRQDARDYWEVVAGADDGDSLDAVMYGDAGAVDEDGEPVSDDADYGDGPLVGFIVGAMEVGWDAGLIPGKS